MKGFHSIHSILASHTAHIDASFVQTCQVSGGIRQNSRLRNPNEIPNNAPPFTRPFTHIVCDFFFCRVPK